MKREGNHPDMMFTLKVLNDIKTGRGVIMEGCVNVILPAIARLKAGHRLHE